MRLHQNLHPLLKPSLHQCLQNTVKHAVNKSLICNMASGFFCLVLLNMANCHYKEHQINKIFSFTKYSVILCNCKWWRCYCTKDSYQQHYLLVLMLHNFLLQKQDDCCSHHAQRWLLLRHCWTIHHLPVNYKTMTPQSIPKCKPYTIFCLNLTFTKPWIARCVYYITNEMQLIQCSLLLSVLYMFQAVLSCFPAVYQ